MTGNTLGPGGFKLVDGIMELYGGMGLLWYTGRKFGNCRIGGVYRIRDDEVPALPQQ